MRVKCDARPPPSSYPFPPSFLLFQSAVPTPVYAYKKSTSTRRPIGSCVIKARNFAANEYGERTYPLPLKEIKGDAKRLLPNGVRPYLKVKEGQYLEEDLKESVYVVPLLPDGSSPTGGGSKRREDGTRVDTIFGLIGSRPASLQALKLGSKEYTRLALSGAAATVVCRTLLNPLELAKTRIQLDGAGGKEEEVVALNPDFVKEGREEAGIKDMEVRRKQVSNAMKQRGCMLL